MNRLILRAAALACSLPLVLFGAGCSQQTKTFATANDAVDSMVVALRADDTAQLSRILGSDADEILSSGDPIADANGRKEFLQRYDQKHRLVPTFEPEGDGAADGSSMTLEVGDNEWPMPIPIVKDADGWRFDTAAGLEEMLNRRIGNNELDTIETCRAVDDAQSEYFTANPSNSPTPEFARKFISTPGTRDGLYWPTNEGEAPSPLGELVSRAAVEGYTATGKGDPYHGYHYRMLTAQGAFAPGGTMSYLTGDRLTKGFAVIAYPAQYGNSGIMTFIMNQQGIVYQRDLGPSTESRAKAVTEFDPDASWAVVE